MFKTLIFGVGAACGACSVCFYRKHKQQTVEELFNKSRVELDKILEKMKHVKEQFINSKIMR